MRPTSASIQKLRAESSNGSHRVTAEIEHREIWFESRDVSLCASSEAFGSALLIPSQYAHTRLRLESAVCPIWRAGAEQAAALSSRWWQLPDLAPETTSLPTPSSPGSAHTALCFTGGLDSFHALLRGHHRPTLLVFVRGYDIPLADEARFQAFARSFHDVARQVGIRPVVVSTNLREHPFVNRGPWNHIHGGALAAIGHLLAGHVGQLIIASSVARTYDIPWGSHWQLDPLWSSGAVRIRHEGAEYSREQKAWSVAHEPLLQAHLRVCWENREPTGNCSVCDKCVNTMLLLHQAGWLEAFTVFRTPPAFVPLLDALPRTTFVRVYRAMCERGLPPEVEAAVQRLLRRTEQAAARHAARTRWRHLFDTLRFRRKRLR